MQTEAHKKYAVHGAYGFVGSEICKNENFIPNEDDPYDKDHYSSKHPDIVYCISTVHNYNVLNGHPYLDVDTNITRLIKTLETNRSKYGKDFSITFVSSWFVYGQTSELPATEQSLCNPTGFYSITKYTAEQLLTSYCKTYGIDYKIVRLASVLGLGDKKVSAQKNALQYMIQRLADGLDVDVYAGGAVRDFIHISDAAEAIRRVARSKVSGEIYNAGSGKGTDIADILSYAISKMTSHGDIHTKPVPDFHKIVQVKDFYMDASKIENTLGWKPVRELKDVIDEIVRGYSGE